MNVMIETCTNPFHNLATEEVLLDNITEPCIYLWRNEPSVILGRNQDALAEVNQVYTSRQGIHIARRITGGGAVYHDLGNVNISYIFRCDESKDFDYHVHEFMEWFIAYLQSIDIEPIITGRNDICIRDKEGNLRKIAGTAMTQRGSQGLFHLCLLYDTDREEMENALTPSVEKLASKGIASVRSRTINLKEAYPHFSERNSDWFFHHLMEHFSTLGNRGSIPASLTSFIDDVCSQRYTQDAWTFKRIYE